MLPQLTGRTSKGEVFITPFNLIEAFPASREDSLWELDAQVSPC